MITTALWRIAIIAVTLVTIGVQFDRQARATPAIAASVPEPFRAFAQAAIAVNALQGSDPELALREAQYLVAVRPVPAEHIRLLAQAQFAAGQLADGSVTIQVAAQRGWRDPLAQEAMLRLAIAADDQAEAARRYAALFLRRDTDDATLVEVGPAVLAEPRGPGRQTLTEIVGGGERWHNQFLRRGARTIPADAFVEIVSETTANGAQYDCNVLRQSTDVLGNRDAKAGKALGPIIDAQC
jgi:hypothetical protein